MSKRKNSQSSRGTTQFEQDVGWKLHLPPGDVSRPLLVALHGMGQDAEHFFRRIEPLVTDDRIVLVPDAPLPLEITRKDGRRREGRAWYIYTGDQEQFLDSATRSGNWLLRVVDEVMKDHPVDPERVTLMGYSQGGYLAGLVVPRNRNRFRALVSIASRIKTEVIPEGAVRDLPVLAVHGQNDTSVDPTAARESAEKMEALGADVSFHALDTDHRITTEQLDLVRSWLDERGL